MNARTLGHAHVMLLLVALSAPLQGATPADAASVDPAARCVSLKTAHFESLTDAPSRIISTAVTRLAPDVPEACQVDGFVIPSVGFRLSLPLSGWNGKFLQGGCGGGCGTTRQFWCEQPLRTGYACISTDMGHIGGVGDWLWAYNDLSRRADFGYRSTHVTLLAGKAIAAAYYGRAPRRSYFFGCSTGGRQAFVAAQRFPKDYDGIVAGAPPLSETGSAVQLAWSVLANLRADGSSILTAAAVRRLHAAVVDACDMNDGIKDGLIGDPRQCRVDISRLQCAANIKPTATDNVASCLSAEQIQAARKIYEGPVDRAGHRIGRQGGLMLGSELWWINDYVAGESGAPPQYLPFITEFFRYMAFDPSPGPPFQLKDLDFDKDPARLGVMEVVHNAGNPDLREFMDAGGKLLAFQGWGDTSIVPGGLVDYFETAGRVIGDPEKMRSFFRFFTVPGMRHCSADGSGGDMIDWLDALDQWVDEGKAPEVLVGVNYDWQGPATRSPVFPVDPARVRLTRPAYQYPAVPYYTGAGDPNDPASYRPSVPAGP